MAKPSRKNKRTPRPTGKYFVGLYGSAQCWNPAIIVVHLLITTSTQDIEPVRKQRRRTTNMSGSVDTTLENKWNVRIRTQVAARVTIE